jgi:hypothetical protein
MWPSHQAVLRQTVQYKQKSRYVTRVMQPLLALAVLQHFPFFHWHVVRLKTNDKNYWLNSKLCNKEIN